MFEDESDCHFQYCFAFLGLMRIKLKLNIPISLLAFDVLPYIKMLRACPVGTIPPLRYLDNETVHLLKQTKQLRASYSWRSIRRLVISRQIAYYWMELPARNTTRERDHKRAREEYERM
eukprot:1911105-Prymnesium_polylepis.1